MVAAVHHNPLHGTARPQYPWLGAVFVAAAAVLPACEETPARSTGQQAGAESQRGMERRSASDGGSAPSFRELAPREVVQARQLRAATFAEQYLKRSKAGTFEALGAETTEELRKTMTPGNQKQAHAAIVRRFGEFQSMQYVGAWASTTQQQTVAFRFRGRFSKHERPEIRVVLDGSDQVAGFFIKPWRDELR